jgi:hypothetical protein
VAFRPRAAPPERRRRHVVFGLLAALSIFIFVNVETGGTYRLTYPVAFGSFFDYQASSLLQGRIDVPEVGIGGEAFVVSGKYYGYFGVTPSLLRLPLVAAEIAFGELSRWYLLAYFSAALIGAYALLRQATRMARGVNAEPSYWAIALVTIASGLGSTLFFLGCRAYIYHEATMCGATFAVWTAYFGLRYLDNPERRFWVGALVCGFLSVNARPSSGLFALCFVGVVAAYNVIRALMRREFIPARHHVLIGVGAVAAVLSFNAMSFWKFRTFDGSPFRYSVQFDPQRLANIEGKNFHLVNIRRNLDEYVLAPNFHLEKKFPFFFFDSLHPRSYPEAKIDLAESTVALPYAMTGLVAAVLIGGVFTLWRVAPLRPALVLLIVGVAPMFVALLAAVATSHRHTGDFCPFLIATAACGIAGLDGIRWRVLSFSILTVATAWAVFATTALSLQFQGDRVWGSPPETVARFQHMRQWFDGIIGKQKQ